MKQINMLTKRNIKIFFSSKSNIFFSFLSLMILVLLHFIIFRKMNADSLAKSAFITESKWAFWFADSLMFSSLIPIGAITISISSLAQIVADKEKKVINDFYIAPMNKKIMISSYILSSLCIGLILLTVLIIFFEIFMLIVYRISFSFLQILAIFGITIFSLFFANIFIFFMVSFINAQQAMGALGAILGALLGFLTGGYIPVGILGKFSNVLVIMPFLPLNALSRRIFFMNVSKTQLSSTMIFGEHAKFYGYELFLGEHKLSILVINLMIIIYSVLLTAILLVRFNRMKNKD